MADDVAVWTPIDDVDDDLVPTCRMMWLSSQARIPALSGFSGSFHRNFGELYRARFNSDFDDLYITGLVSTRGISAASQNRDLRTLEILEL